jgi:hypothetical protein
MFFSKSTQSNKPIQSVDTQDESISFTLSTRQVVSSTKSGETFFDFSLHQTVSSALCIILLISWCIFMVVYYATHSLDTFQQTYVVISAHNQNMIDGK